MRFQIAFFLSILACCLARGQSAPSTPPHGTESSSSAMDSNGVSHGEFKDSSMSTKTDAGNDVSGAAAHAMHSMEGHMDMGPHMKMTALRQPRQEDRERAQKIAEQARKVAEKYIDYHTVLADGFKIFLPNVPQKMYHFTNYSYAAEAQVRFNPEHPTSLLYEKHGDGYRLIGVMYTAPKRFTEDELDDRIPLSVAQWHEHVNFCAPPGDRKGEVLSQNPQFGLRGSITTQQACDAAGGTFYPVIFNWMVHVYPFEKDQARIWSVDRQHADTDMR